MSLLRELMELVEDQTEGGGTQKGIKNEGEGEKGIESMVPSGMAKKTIWAHGMDVLGYSVNSFRLTNLKFKNSKSPRLSEVVRLQMNKHYTSLILSVSVYFSSAVYIRMCNLLLLLLLYFALNCFN